MAIEIANNVHAMAIAALANSGAMYLRQNGFAGAPVRVALGVFMLDLNERLGFSDLAQIPAEVQVSVWGAPAARIAMAAIVPVGDGTYPQYAGQVAVRIFDAAGAAVDEGLFSVEVKRFPTTT